MDFFRFVARVLYCTVKSKKPNRYGIWAEHEIHKNNM